MLEVLGRATSGNVQKVLFLLEELGAPYKRHDYGKTFEGTTLTPQYQAINPTQKVPTLRDGELHVWESHTILRYVANKQEAHALYPRDPAARSQVERWMDWTLASLNVAYLAGFKEAKLPPEQLSEALRAAVRRAVAAGRARRAGPGSRARPSPWPTSAWRRWCAAA
ncbi:glutathione S-transferase N-terminal domain-containing protein [Achromobacter xylosoxidans]